MFKLSMKITYLILQSHTACTWFTSKFNAEIMNYLHFILI